jgi:hypothetical protein
MHKEIWNIPSEIQAYVAIKGVLKSETKYKPKLNRNT